MVKRAYVELRERVTYLKRLAFYTITGEGAAKSEYLYLTGSKPYDKALDCYVTYQATIEAAGVRRNIPRKAVFDIYQEAHDPLLDSLAEGLTANG